MISAQSSCSSRDSACHRLLYDRDELLKGERLGQEIELLVIGQALESVLGIARHKDDLDIRIALAQLLNQCGPVHFRHHHVGDDKIDATTASVELFQRLDAVAGLYHC